MHCGKLVRRRWSNGAIVAALATAVRARSVKIEVVGSQCAVTAIPRAGHTKKVLVVLVVGS